MKIGYFLPYFAVTVGSFGGLKMQALQWKEMLQKKGNDVVEITPWGTYDWNSFDVIQFFFFGSSFFSIYEEIKTRASSAKFVCAPILDPHYPLFVYQILSKISFAKAKIFSDYCAPRKYQNLFDVFLARTQYEKNRKKPHRKNHIHDPFRKLERVERGLLRILGQTIREKYQNKCRQPPCKRRRGR